MTHAKQPVSFQDQLIDDEQILWEGAPAISFLHFLRLKIMRPVLIVYVVVILFLIGFLSGGKSQPNNIMALLMAGLFIAIGLLVYIPYVLFDNYREYRRYGLGFYAVTDKRILVRSKAGLSSIPINAIPGIVKIDEKNGLGTIHFQLNGSPILYRIKEVDKVYKLVNDLRSKSS